MKPINCFGESGERIKFGGNCGDVEFQIQKYRPTPFDKLDGMGDITHFRYGAKYEGFDIEFEIVPDYPLLIESSVITRFAVVL